MKETNIDHPTPATMDKLIKFMSKDNNEFNEKLRLLEARNNIIAQREEKLSKDFAERSKTLQKREERLSHQEKEMSAHFAKMKEDFDKEKESRLLAIDEKIKSLEKERLESIKERDRLSKEYQEILEQNSTEYIEKTLETLRTRYTKLDHLATTWKQVGALPLLAGLAILLYYSNQIRPFEQQIEWKTIIYMSIRGSAFLGLLGAFSAYAANTSNSIRAEATLTSDRIHAIDYGAFYLNTYGKNASWEQIDDVFKHWNSVSPQTKKESDFDDKDEIKAA